MIYNHRAAGNINYRGFGTLQLINRLTAGYIQLCVVHQKYRALLPQGVSPLQLQCCAAGHIDLPAQYTSAAQRQDTLVNINAAVKRRGLAGQGQRRPGPVLDDPAAAAECTPVGGIPGDMELSRVSQRDHPARTFEFLHAKGRPARRVYLECPALHIEPGRTAHSRIAAYHERTSARYDGLPGIVIGSGQGLRTARYLEVSGPGYCAPKRGSLAAVYIQGFRAQGHRPRACQTPDFRRSRR